MCTMINIFPDKVNLPENVRNLVFDIKCQYIFWTNYASLPWHRRSRFRLIWRSVFFQIFIFFSFIPTTGIKATAGLRWKCSKWYVLCRVKRCHGCGRIHVLYVLIHTDTYSYCTASSLFLWNKRVFLACRHSKLSTSSEVCTDSYNCIIINY